MEILEYIQNNQTYLLMISGILGLVIGSFLNVVIYRLPLMLHHEWVKECTSFLTEYYHKHDDTMKLPEPNVLKLNLAWPNSHCPQCKHPLGILENIPVISYLFQKGRCKHCEKAIPLQYPLVESLTAILTAVTVWHFGFTSTTLIALIFTWSLVILSFIDFNEQILPDHITLFMLWFGLFISTFAIFTTPTAAILGAIVGYLSLWLVYQLFKLLTKKEGIGFGDFKLFAMLGAFLGWQALPFILIISSFTGAVVGLLLIALGGHKKHEPIPFGPFLALAGWISLLWGDIIQSKYLSYLGL